MHTKARGNYDSQIVRADVPELTPDPSSLFKDGLMRKPAKASLRTHLTKNARPQRQPSKCVVIDGGALLWSVNWMRNSTYDDITNFYVRHLTVRHPNCNVYVAFDGYYDSMSTKVHEQTRRKVTTSANVKISDTSMYVTCTSEAKQNKTSSQLMTSHSSCRSKFERRIFPSMNNGYYRSSTPQGRNI